MWGYGSWRQLPHGVAEGDPPQPHHESDHITADAARKAKPEPLPRMDMEAGAVVIVEGATGHHLAPTLGKGETEPREQINDGHGPRGLYGESPAPLISPLSGT